MARANFAFSSFTSGELSERLTGRIDLKKYFSGCETLENFMIHPHGGASRRPGTTYVADAKSDSAVSRLVSFEFNVTQAYCLEFFNNGFRIFKDGGQVTSGSPAAAVEVTTTYTTAQLSELKFAQSADVMYVVHPSHPVRKIARTSHTAWTITDVDFQRGPFLDANTTTTTLTANNRTGSSITITASAATGINGGDGFTANDVGRIVKLHHGYAEITARASATSVTATALENDLYTAELEPTYAATTISFVEGDPSSTGLEHNDRIVDTAKSFIKQGFLDNMTITVSGTSSNNGDYLIVKVTEDTLLVSPSDDVAAESAGSSFTLVGKLAADDSWALGAFSPQTGYPSAIAFYEQRLVLAGTSDQPQTVFFSNSGDFENFTAGTADGDALIYTLGSNEVNVIRYLSSSRALLVGTSGGEFAVRAGGTDEPISPTNIQIKQQSAFGSANIQPVQVGSTVLFLQRASRKLRELVYNFNSDSYVAPDLTILAEHITDGGLTEFAYQQEPDSIVWAVRSDGVLLGMTYRREEEVVGWHRHVIGGVSGACTITVTDYANIAVGTTLTLTKSDGTTVVFTSEAISGDAPAETLGWRPNTSNDVTADNIFTAINAHADFTVANPAANVVTIKETARAGTGFLSVLSSDTTRLATTDQSHALVESVTTIPGTNEDEVWLTVQRTINGSTKRTIEYIKNFDFGSDVADAFFVDSGLTYSGSSATSLSGLGHLEAESVAINANGANHALKTVASGAVTLDHAVTKAHVGLNYASTLKTMRIEAGSTDGTAQGKIKRIDDVVLRLYRSVNARVGASTTSLDRIPFRSGADEMDVAIPLFTGDVEIEMPAGYDQDGYVIVQQDLPLAMTLLAIFARVQTYD